MGQVRTCDGLVFPTFEPYGGTWLVLDNVISHLILVDPVGRDLTSAEWAGEIRTAIAAGSDGGS
jgi:hypothetical protein